MKDFMEENKENKELTNLIKDLVISTNNQEKELNERQRIEQIIQILEKKLG